MPSVWWEIVNEPKSRLHIIGERYPICIFRDNRCNSINDNHNYNLSFVSIYEDTMYAIIKVRIFRSSHTHLYAREMCTIDHTLYILIFAYIAYIRFICVHVYACVCVCLCMHMCANTDTQIIRVDSWSCTCVYWYICICTRAHQHTTLSFSLARLWQ